MASGGWGYSANPFAGTSTTQAASNDEQPQNAFGAWGGGVGVAPKPAAPFNVASTPTAAAAGVGNSSSREADLARREAEVSRREAQLAQLAASASPKNFPPLCPCIYHSIAGQIPAWNRSMIRFHFITELLVLLGFLYNTAIMLAAMFSGIIGLNWWLFSVITLTTGAPLSWMLYYKSLFGAAQTDGKTYPYMRSVLLMMINIAWCVWMVLGLKGLGEFSGGVFPMLGMFKAGGSQGLTFGILYAINVGIWAVAGIGGWFSIGMAVAAYRRGDKPRKDYENRFGYGAAV